MTERPIVEIQQVSKQFGSVYAVDEISLEIYRGEFFSLLGASGCGKTTLLRMLAGFEEPTSGRIIIDGQDMTKVPAYARPVNMMFQSYALFPHMTVADNIAYGLRQDGMGKSEREARVKEMMALVKIDKYAQRKPHQLSGGQRQRVALARALAKQPKILLLDEPLGALDKKLREETQFELVNIQERLNATFIVVTHDQEEAMTMSTRIALMHAGRIEQLDMSEVVTLNRTCRRTTPYTEVRRNLTAHLHQQTFDQTGLPRTVVTQHDDGRLDCYLAVRSTRHLRIKDGRVLDLSDQFGDRRIGG